MNKVRAGTVLLGLAACLLPASDGQDTRVWQAGGNAGMRMCLRGCMSAIPLRRLTGPVLVFLPCGVFPRAPSSLAMHSAGYAGKVLDRWIVCEWVGGKCAARRLDVTG
jgi:hypothetical protein